MNYKKNKSEKPKFVICDVCKKHVALTNADRLELHTLISGETKLCPNAYLYTIPKGL